jgi:hypothetical protein
MVASASHRVEQRVNRRGFRNVDGRGPGAIIDRCRCHPLDALERTGNVAGTVEARHAGYCQIEFHPGLF